MSIPISQFLLALRSLRRTGQEVISWILFIRHGETDWNLEKLMQGHKEVPLNKKGQQQAQKIATQLKNFPIDILYSSPLARAYETAKTIHTHHPHVSFFTDDALKERSFGLLEGKSYETIWQTYPELQFGQSWNYLEFQPPQGERLTDVQNRTKNFLKKMLNRYEGKTIAIVSHGIAIRCMICALLDFPLNHNVFIELGNTALTILKQPKQGPGELHTLNNLTHLTYL